MSSHFKNEVVGVHTSVPTVRGPRPYINLDNAATTPAFVSVVTAVNNFLPWYSSVHRGSGFKSRLSTTVYEQAREVVMRFVGANPNDHIVIFGKNTTEAINKLSYRLQLSRRDVVLVSPMEHHSNDLPWRAQARAQRMTLDSRGGIDRASFKKQLKHFAGQVKLVALTGGSNVTGYMPDIHWFARQAHAAGAQILVDCAQLAAHRPITMRPLDDPAHLDYIALSGHKLYAPFGSGALIARRDTFNRGEPEYRGGGTILSVTPKHVDWALPPDSDEAGSPNVVGTVALADALKTITRLGFANIEAHESELTAYALLRLSEVPRLTLYGNRNPVAAHNRLGVIPFSLPHVPAQLVAAALGHEWGIGVRSGCFCAQPYVMHLLGLTPRQMEQVRYRLLHKRRDLVPALVRISFGLYNTREDIDALIEALTAISTGPPQNYHINRATGQYTPRHAPMHPSHHFSL